MAAAQTTITPGTGKENEGGFGHGFGENLSPEQVPEQKRKLSNNVVKSRDSTLSERNLIEKDVSKSEQPPVMEDRQGQNANAQNLNLRPLET